MTLPTRMSSCGFLWGADAVAFSKSSGIFSDRDFEKKKEPWIFLAAAASRKRKAVDFLAAAAGLETMIPGSGGKRTQR